MEDDLLVQKVEELQELIKVQKNCCTSNYQIGLYNGLVLALSVLTGEEPQFYEQGKEDGRNGV